jgi:ABC-2 type transport system ATP-binding protein
MKYANGKGIFDVDFEVREGEVVGFLGPNGAGKTTTIRCLLGFAKAQNGTCTVNGLECFSNAPKIAKDIGFIAGEPAFPDGMTGLEYLNYLCETRKRDVAFDMKKKMHELIDYFEFDPKGKIKRMSKGMKQKTAIVGAFLHDPKVYIFDEPTSGLDPIMQSKFIDLVLAEKKRGKTILMSSHMFEEIERASDYVVIIKGGRIVAKDKVATLKNLTSKVFIVNGEEVTVPNTEVDKFVKQIAKKKVESLDVKQVSLESIFMKYYEDKEGAKK